MTDQSMADPQEPAAEVPATTEDAEPTDVALSSGEAMQPVEAARIVGSRRTRIVVFAGAADSGKTTLISSIYERFGRGHFAELAFAGSETLMTFERLCHLSRGTSLNSHADTERTKQLEGHKMLHMRLAGAESIEDLLLTDISGEEYAAAYGPGSPAHRSRRFPGLSEQY